MGKGVGRRRKTEKFGDRKKAVWPGMGTWLSEVVPLLKNIKFSFLVSGAGAVDPSLGDM
jgi:hypothetical protein